ncbi:MAG: reductive dehalogenase [Bacteroidales bacterium]|jgi:reductive dehalogenase|nr:reductive dehalogenase [Bacteroidales bacterium]
MVDFLLLVTGLSGFIILFYTALISYTEKEFRAARISLFLSTAWLILFLLTFWFNFPGKETVSFLILGGVFLGFIVIVLPINHPVKEPFPTPVEKHDERDVMFSRNELQPGTSRYDEYYNKNPERKSLDGKFREKPGLLSSGSLMYHSVMFAAAEATFETIEALKPWVNGPVAEAKIPVNPPEISNYMKRWIKKQGAHSVGITGLKNYHLYSHKGRGDLYGKEIKNTHSYAIALTVEMDHEMIQTAPKAPVTMESSQQYLTSGTLAVQLAAFIRRLGYSARAHIDGNYELICPLVARDAGLGEIGRMGLLMTPLLGPRIRIAVVTTDMPLPTDQRKDYSSVIDFCNRCKKCADACPSASIPHAGRTKEKGVSRWKINSESCFTYWSTIGTDCGRCISVCPYAHPNSPMHNVIRWGIGNSTLFRRFALWMDDLFYGRKPKASPIPFWLNPDC